MFIIIIIVIIITIIIIIIFVLFVSYFSVCLLVRSKAKISVCIFKFSSPLGKSLSKNIGRLCIVSVLN